MIKRCISNFHWEQHFRLNPDPNWQVNFFTDTIMNIMTNFIPNKTIQVVPSDPPWIDQSLKSMLNKQNRMYKNYKKHGFKPCDKLVVDKFREDCESRIQIAKSNYLNKLGNRLIDPNTSQKSYWKIINRVMNKCKAPKIPPLLVNNKYIINCKEKADMFATYFSNQCKVIVSNSILPNFTYFTEARLDNIAFTDNDILLLIRNLKSGKSNGPDRISARMLLFCDDSIILPLRLIFQNILFLIYGNEQMLPLFTKKETNKLLKIIGLYHYYQFVVNCLKKLYSTIFTIFLIQTHSSPKINLVFGQVIQLLIN